MAGSGERPREGETGGPGEVASLDEELAGSLDETLLEGAADDAAPDPGPGPGQAPSDEPSPPGAGGPETETRPAAAPAPDAAVDTSDSVDVADAARARETAEPAEPQATGGLVAEADPGKVPVRPPGDEVEPPPRGRGAPPRAEPSGGDEATATAGKVPVQTQRERPAAAVRLLRAMNAPLRRLPPAGREVVDWVAVSLVCWVPLVWFFALVIAGR